MINHNKKTKKKENPMRSYILTEEEQNRLKTWIETGKEDQTTRNLFTKIRTSLPRLQDDTILIIKTRKKLKERKRWLRKPRSGST